MIERDVSKAFGIAVRSQRTKLGFSQETLAEKAGVHPTYVGLVERGKRSPTLRVAHALAKALKTELPRLLSRR